MRILKIFLPSSRFWPQRFCGLLHSQRACSSLGYHIPADLTRKLLVFMAMTVSSVSCLKMLETCWWIDAYSEATSQGSVAFEGAGLTEIISCLTTPEKAVEFSLNPTNLNGAYVAYDKGTQCSLPNMLSGMLDTVSYNVARKNKDLALYEIGKIWTNR